VKEFVTAVEETIAEDDYEAKVKALVEQGKTREEAEAEVDSEVGVVPFKVDDRVLKAYPLHEGQLTFMLAALGRGQSQESRFAAIINIMMEALRDDDQIYLEGRLLTRDPKKRLPMKTVEGIFEYLIEEWFARPTQQQSGSAGLQPSGGPNSTPPTPQSDSSDSGPTGS
jgi:hypothetical protein